MTTDEARNLTDVVFGFLSTRCGFDAWWGDIDDEVAEEIAEGLAAAILEATADPRYTLTPLGAAMLEGKKNGG